MLIREDMFSIPIIIIKMTLRLYNMLAQSAERYIVKLEQKIWGVQCRHNTTDSRVFEQVFYDFPKCFTTSTARVIVDAGANVGFSAVWFARKYKDAVVYAIEPNAANYRALVENCKMYSNIVPIHAAISNQDGEMFCVDIDDGEWAYVISATCTDSSKSEKCTVFSMKSFLEKYAINHIDILKVDIEGSECELFDASANTWISMCGQINIEPHDWLTTESSRVIFRCFDGLPEYACHVAGEHFIFVKKTV